MKEINSNSKKNYLFSHLITSYFSSLGVRYAFISPGSRNTPLTQALINNKNIKTFSIIDERASAFIGLGKTKSDKSNQPVIVVTTSGTAVANLFPGIVESFMSKKSIIIITADRPKKLIGTGSNQTIYQDNIFGKYAKYFDSNNFIKKTEEYYKKYINEDQNSKLFNFIKNIYMTSICGINNERVNRDFSPTPVHMNIPFDEPLYFSGSQSSIPELKTNKITFKREYNSLGRNLGYNHSKILIICTDICDMSIIKATKKYHIPIFMESRSMRYEKVFKNIITSYDMIIKNEILKPDIILRFGSRPISKKLNQFLDQNKKITYLLQGFNEKDYKSNWIDTSKLNQYFKRNEKTIDKYWCDNLIKKQSIVKKHIDSFFKNIKSHEGNIISEIISYLPNKSNLMIGNSSPIRDLDTFTFNIDKSINVLSNRGASGIDGLISTAIGMSIDNKSFNALIIGDVSFYYDLSSLNIAKDIPISLTIFIINNQGGHIFDRLEGLKTQKISIYEKYWITPPELDIKSLSKAFNCNYNHIGPSQYEKIGTIINNIDLKDKKINLIEIKVDPRKHKLNNLKIEEKIRKALN